MHHVFMAEAARRPPASSTADVNVFCSGKIQVAVTHSGFVWHIGGSNRQVLGSTGGLGDSTTSTQPTCGFDPSTGVNSSLVWLHVVCLGLGHLGCFY
jgi:hypothetical protein